MRELWIVMRKELIDAFRDRRMVLMAFLVMPLAVPSLPISRECGAGCRPSARARCGSS